ncbi:MAG TPA: hypothetical protein VJ650_14325 [Gemmatimonadaceae bacterium]|nr:hypothetical protein [Gemmatimonadaceae bacterium]
MRIAAVLEIAPESSGALPTGLLAAAYRASSVGYVMLALRGVSPQMVDRVLDPLVSSSRNWRLNGVVYVDARDEQFVCSAAQRARVVVPCSDEFRAQLDAREIAYAPDLRSAMERLSELERGVGVAIPPATPVPSVAPVAASVANA